MNILDNRHRNCHHSGGEKLRLRKIKWLVKGHTAKLTQAGWLQTKPLNHWIILTDCPRMLTLPGFASLVSIIPYHFKVKCLKDFTALGKRNKGNTLCSLPLSFDCPKLVTRSWVRILFSILGTPALKNRIPIVVLCPGYLQVEKGGTEVVKTDILRSLLTTQANCTKLHWNCWGSNLPEIGHITN